MRQIVLASTSPYRRQLLQQLQIPFVTASPLCFEEVDQSLAPELVVRHLSLQKATSLAKHFPDALIIGSDQVFVDARKRILGKPGSVEAAFSQLRVMSGRCHSFFTGVAVVDSRSGESVFDHDVFSVTLKNLTDDQIRNYLERDRPFDCSGSFKIEGLGIALMEKMEGNDYTSLIGLPLIKVCQMLSRFDVDVLGVGG